MLPDSIKPIGFDTWKKETWDQYRDRINLSDDYATNQFYRQVVYDHFEHFNEHYPDFQLEKYSFRPLTMTARLAYDSIRFFESQVMDWWSRQYDVFEEQGHDYIVFQHMSKMFTFPFPPILLDPKISKGKGRLECGRPLHLIEGTHRVSYLRHMLDRSIVTADSLHQFVLVAPTDPNESEV